MTKTLEEIDKIAHKEEAALESQKLNERLASTEIDSSAFTAVSAEGPRQQPTEKTGARQFPSGSASLAVMKSLNGERGRLEKDIYIVEEDSKTQTVFDASVQKLLNDPCVFDFFLHALSVFKETGGKGENRNLIVFRLSDYAKRFKIGKSTAYKAIQKGLYALSRMQSIQYFESSIKSELKNFKIYRFFEDLQYLDGLVVISLAKDTANILRKYSTLLLDERILQLSKNSFPFASKMLFFIENHRQNTPEKRMTKSGIVLRNRITVAYLLDKCGFPSPENINFKHKERIIKPFVKHMDAMYKDWHLEDALYKKITRKHKGEVNRDSYELLKFSDFIKCNVYTNTQITDLLPLPEN